MTFKSNFGDSPALTADTSKLVDALAAPARVDITACDANRYQIIETTADSTIGGTFYLEFRGQRTIDLGVDVLVSVDGGVEALYAEGYLLIGDNAAITTTTTCPSSTDRVFCRSGIRSKHCIRRCFVFIQWKVLGAIFYATRGGSDSLVAPVSLPAAAPTSIDFEFCKVALRRHGL